MALATIPLGQPPKCGRPFPVPSYGNGGVFSVSCSTIIEASPQTCLETVLDTAKYPQWNSFCPEAYIDSAPDPSTIHLDPDLRRLAVRPGHIYPGVKMRFEARLKANADPYTTSLEATVLERFEEDGRTGYRVAWRVSDSRVWLLRGERVQEFLEVPAKDGGQATTTEYRSWETFGGVLAYYIYNFMQSQLKSGFRRWMDGLKKASEEAERDKRRPQVG
ncbi:hypothetical protein SODALDRAFT_331830 [Sodiomyces alkalinus F11]|uniref:Coenzyme Q-binding protein COQ10 START domain-containing protein n=1 Tax=Sodiomyces alkalinus (strain CBS 110278 / VKM F-3762 / F11) TaxID=1314773 RepID=A0A3N2PZD6_SODAK|nr:hypothetical protein SODALDRAFT_331830 [Sodiomyces alkalinus F11]ROT39715.1 hypothetical protein SODALDRAFT_331830 [Sodiomyces alkalinus F11]